MFKIIVESNGETHEYTAKGKEDVIPRLRSLGYGIPSKKARKIAEWLDFGDSSLDLFLRASGKDAACPDLDSIRITR